MMGEDSRLAYHEAAHAVVASALGLRVNGVFIDGPPGDQQGGTYAEESRDLGDFLAVGVAGSLGEILAGYPARGPSPGDVTTMQRRRPPVSDEDWRALVLVAQGRAAALLRANWPAVEALARDLRRLAAVGEARIAAIVDTRGEACRT